MFNSIKIHELSDLKETYAVITLDDERGLEWLEWSDDGQLLAVATPAGNILTKPYLCLIKISAVDM